MLTVSKFIFLAGVTLSGFLSWQLSRLDSRAASIVRSLAVFCSLSIPAGLCYFVETGNAAAGAFLATALIGILVFWPSCLLLYCFQAQQPGQSDPGIGLTPGEHSE